MALANRIKVTTATTGTGTLTLSSTGVRDATNGDCLAPAEVLSELGGRIVSYAITSGGDFATGRCGRLSANGLSLERCPTEMSWDGSTYTQAPLSLTGTSTVIITPGPADFSASSAGLSNMVVLGRVTL